MHLKGVVNLLDQNQSSVANIVSILQTCRKVKSLKYANNIISNHGFEAQAMMGNYVVPMFVECGSISDAQQAFNRLFDHNEHSWTSLILGYMQCGQPQNALNLYQKMQEDKVHPNGHTLTALLRACARVKDRERGRQLHFQIVEKGIDVDAFVGSALVDMYVKCGSLEKALEVFNTMSIRDIASWTALIAGYVENGFGLEALKYFEQMKVEGLSPNPITFVCCLKACSSLENINKARKIHAEISQNEFERNPFICSALIDMYVNCGSLLEAQALFDKLPIRGVALWNALIGGYADIGFGEHALKCFEQMEVEGISADDVTFVSILNACGCIEAVDRGRRVHIQIAHRGHEQNLPICNALIDMYVKCGSFLEARNVFEKMLIRNVVSWTTLIGGYAEHGLGHEALALYQQMQVEGISPDAITLVCCLKACGSTGAIGKAQEIHDKILNEQLDRNLLFGNALIDMYTKCCSLTEAHESFNKLLVQDVASWNAMIRGYGMNNDIARAVLCFEDMQAQGVRPDAVTFLCLLAACSRTSLVFEGLKYYNMMKIYGISPAIDHYGCMVDLLARSGNLYEAKMLLQSVPYFPAREMVTPLLSACKTYGETEVGLFCFQHLVRINPQNSSPYVHLSNMYLAAGRQDDANKIEELRNHAGAKKKPAKALIEVNKKMHEFVVGDNQNEETLALLNKLHSLMKEKGYWPNVDLVLKHNSDEDKEAMLCGHVERLAIAFGLLNTPQGETLRVTKNLRMCNDCHSAGKIISNIERRDIILRESNWVHHFQNGLCSCGDMW